MLSIHPKRIIAACSMGTILEWYDFSIYAYLAPILATLFFPSTDHFTAIILAYSVFAIGFIVRPLGAILFGHFGDKIGRKKVLIYSIIFIASSTALMGLLPTYQQIGKWAPILLIVLRILQGLTIGGEITGATSFVIESTHPTKRAFATSIVWASSGVGILLSSLVVSMMTAFMTPTELSDWGWRFPFLLGAITGIIGYYLRINTYESAEFQQMQAERRTVSFPLGDITQHFKKKVAITLGLYVLSAIITYLIFVYMPVYSANTIGLPLKHTMAVNTFVMTFMIMIVPLFGYYADRVGRRRMLLIGSMTLFILAFPLYALIIHGSLMNLILGQCILGTISASYQGAITRAVLEMFPTHVRYSAAALGYNLAYSLFGGTAPMIAVYLIQKFQFNTAPGLYLMLGALLSFIAAYKLQKDS